MIKSELLETTTRWRVCEGDYEIKPIEYSEEGPYPWYLPDGDIPKHYVVPKTDQYRMYNFPLPHKALWSFLGHRITEKYNGEDKGKFLSDEELVKWTNNYGWLELWYQTLEALRFEQRLMLGVFRLIEGFSEPEKRENGYHYVDGIRLDGWFSPSFPEPNEVDRIMIMPSDIEVDLALVAARHVFWKRLGNVRVNARIIPAERKIEKNLESNLLGNLWITLLDVLFGRESDTAKCIFCGIRDIIGSDDNGIEHLKYPSRKIIKGYYHERCRGAKWREGQRHPEKQEELNRKYGLTWGTKRRGK